VLSGTMEDIGDGIYSISITMTIEGQYRVVYDLPDYYLDAIETLIVEDKITKSQITALQAKLDTIYSLLITNGPVVDHKPSIDTDINSSSTNNVVTLFIGNAVGFGIPVRTVNFTSISIQCVSSNTTDIAKIYISNDFSNWSLIHTFIGSGTLTINCFKWTVVELIQGNICITGVMHK